MAPVLWCMQRYDVGHEREIPVVDRASECARELLCWRVQLWFRSLLAH